jgi:hypothetical protein
MQSESPGHGRMEESLKRRRTPLLFYSGKKMNAKWIDIVNRGMKLIVAMVIAGVVVWRGDLCAERDVNLLTASMSLVFGLVVLLTGLALTFETDESR